MPAKPARLTLDVLAIQAKPFLGRGGAEQQHRIASGDAPDVFFIERRGVGQAGFGQDDLQPLAFHQFTAQMPGALGFTRVRAVANEVNRFTAVGCGDRERLWARVQLFQDDVANIPQGSIRRIDEFETARRLAEARVAGQERLLFRRHLLPATPGDPDYRGLAQRPGDLCLRSREFVP